MLTLTLQCSALTVHPPELPLDMPLRVRVIDVEPEEVLQQIEVAEVVKHFGAQALLCHISLEDIKEHLRP